MGIGRDLNHLELYLHSLFSNIERESLKVWGEGKRPQIDDPGYPAFIASLDKLKGDLERMAQQVHNVERQIAGEMNRGPAYLRARGYGYPATLKQQGTRSAELRTQINQLLGRVLNMLRDDYGVQVIEQTNKLGDNIKEFLKNLQQFKTSTEKPSNSPIFRPTPDATHGAPLGDLITLLSLTIGLLLQVYRDRRKNK